MRRSLVPAFAAIVLVAACHSTARPAARTSPSSSPSPAGVLLQFVRTGGFFSHDDELTVYGDGTFQCNLAQPEGRQPVRGKGRLDDAKLAQIRQLLDSLGTVPTAEAGHGADAFEYLIVSGDRRVTTDDFVMKPPLSTLVAALSGLVEGPCRGG